MKGEMSPLTVFEDDVVGVSMRQFEVGRSQPLEVNHGSHQFLEVVRGSGVIAVSPNVFIPVSQGSTQIICAGTVYGFRSEVREGMTIQAAYRPPFDPSTICEENRHQTYSERRALRERNRTIDMNVQLAYFTRQAGISDRFAGRIIADRLFPIAYSDGVELEEIPAEASELTVS